VSDIFREVEEEVRRERFEQLWKEYGDYIVAGACLIVIAAAGLQLWRTYDQRERSKASNEYAVAEEMLEAGQTVQAADAFGRLADSAPGGYKELARLQHADALTASGERGDALNIYKQIAAGDDALLGAVARMHAAWAIVDFAPRAEVLSTLGPLTDAPNSWRPMAMEVVAYWDYRSGNFKTAQAEYESVAHNNDASASLRTRCKVMSDFLKAGGDNNYGTVPQPKLSQQQALAGPDATAPNSSTPKP
jgi:hypothetical protein